MKASRAKLVGLSLAIFAGTVWLFWPCVHGEFLGGDDDEYLLQSARRNGLTWNAVKWAFTSTDSYYHPLARLSHVLDYQIWRRDAAGHHVTSLVVHALNATLVFGFLWTLLGMTSLSAGERLAVALWAAAVFAIHPLQVESVAWISGRTQLLCATFGIGSLWAYAASGRRWAVWVLYAAALLSKPMAVSLPFVMLVMDYYPLRRYEQLGWARLLWEKVPMVVLAVAAGLMTLVGKSQIGQILPFAAIRPSDRVFLMFQSLMFYPLKLIWPSHMSFSIPMNTGVSLDQWPVLASTIGVVLVTSIVIAERQRLPMLAAAWVAYVMLVLPVSGLVPSGFQVVAQRYAYVAMLPLLLVAGAGGVWMWRHSTLMVHIVLGVLMAGQVCVFAARVRGLIPDWHNQEAVGRVALEQSPDSEPLIRGFAMMLLDQGRANEALPYAQRDVAIAPKLTYSHMALGLVLTRLGRRQEALEQEEQALQLNPLSAEAHFNFGIALMELGKASEAAEHFRQALAIRPNDPLTYDNLGAALSQMGRTAEAIEQFEAGLKIDPACGDAHNSLAIALAQSGRLKEAVAQFQQALQLNPDSAQAHYNLGLALAKSGQLPEAIAHYEQALRIKPDYVEVHVGLGIALRDMGKTPESVSHFEQALRIKPDDAEVHVGLGIALRDMGKTPESISHFEQALRIKPDDAEAHNYLGAALAQTGNLKESISHFEQALRLKPDFAEAHNNLGIDLGRQGMLSEALGHFEQAVRLKPDYIEAHYNLAVDLEKTGRVPEAIEHYQQALKLRPDFTPASDALARLHTQ